jgi:2,5-diketo-D-gluconate reductase A
MSIDLGRGASINTVGALAGPNNIPLVELNDGNRMPQLGFGVWQVSNEDVVPAVLSALEAGYRAVDTAQGYDNEEGVGQALRESGLDRSELFVTSKLRTRLLGHNEAIEGVRQSLDKLQLDYLDLFLIHWPCPALDRYVAAWSGLIEAQQQGLVRSIGVSNFLPEHLERIIAETGVVPVINQVETHPEYQQRQMQAVHDKYSIQHESYSPLGTGAVLDNPEIGRIAESYDKSPAQVIIRWHLQEGFVVIPKSVHEERIRQNLEVFDFVLSEADMEAIRALDRTPDGKTGSDPASFNDLY